MTKIYRDRLTTEEVEVPDGNDVCSACDGKGLVSKYDMGWTSVAHSDELAAKRPCMFCNGLGYRPRKFRDEMEIKT